MLTPFSPAATRIVGHPETIQKPACRRSSHIERIGGSSASGSRHRKTVRSEFFVQPSVQLVQNSLVIFDDSRIPLHTRLDDLLMLCDLSGQGVDDRLSFPLAVRRKA